MNEKTEEHKILGQKVDSMEKTVGMLAEFRKLREGQGCYLEPISGAYYAKATAKYDALDENNYHNWRDYLRHWYGYFDPVMLEDYLDRDFPPCPQDMWLHVSKKSDGAMVAFLENEEKARRDVFTRMKFGRYLVKYHPEMDNEKVKSAVSRFEYEYGEPPSVKFGESKEDFLRVIDDGPDESCMARLNYKGHQHPAVCYASGDMQVAWIEDGSGRVTARTIVNKETKEHSRTYGDAARLDKQLEELGYEKALGALVGCRLLKIRNEAGCGWLMPYVDAGTASGGGNLHAESDGDYWVLNDEEQGISTYEGYRHNGITVEENDEPEYGYCYSCSDRLDNDDDHVYSEHEGQSFCRSCADRYWVYAIVSERNGRADYDYVRDGNAIYVESLGEYALDDSNLLGRLGLVFDSYKSEWIDTDDSVYCFYDEEYHASDDCVWVGEKDGDVLYIHESDLKDLKYTGNIYYDEDNKPFWYESDEVREWLEDEEREEGKYVLKKKPEPVKTQEPTTEPAFNDWRAIYKKMQSRGIKFIMLSPWGGGWCGGEWGFDNEQERYRINPNQTPPSNWQEIYKEAQLAGVAFEVKSRDHAEWYRKDSGYVFNCEFPLYRIYIQTTQQPVRLSTEEEEVESSLSAFEAQQTQETIA